MESGWSRLPVTMNKSEKYNEASFRELAWKAWFEGWLAQPRAKRSTGYHSISDQDLKSTADFIVSVLALSETTDSVLDVGCDSAMVSRFVAPQCLSFVGADFIFGLLADVDWGSIKTASGISATCVAADGCKLPFSSGTFSKAYCSGVIQTLPSRNAGQKMIEEMVRICRPGGTVLVAGVPDMRKRFRAKCEVWRRSGAMARLKLLGSMAVPRHVKKYLRRWFKWIPTDSLVLLDYDLQQLKQRFESAGYMCKTLDYPADYWSRDFRMTRSNLVIHVPLETA